jgi:hypothetical protein
MRLRKTPFALVLLTALAIGGDVPLLKQVEAGDTDEVNQFWAELANRGAPLVEAIPGDDHSSFVTFVWRAKEPIRNVVVFGGVARGNLDQMVRL